MVLFIHGATFDCCSVPPLSESLLDAQAEIKARLKSGLPGTSPAIVYSSDDDATDAVVDMLVANASQVDAVMAIETLISIIGQLPMTLKPTQKNQRLQERCQPPQE